MLASIAFALLALHESVQAHSAVLGSGGHARSVELSMCDTQQPNDALRLMHSELSAQGKLRKVKPRDAEPIVVDTYFHFVVGNDASAQYTPDKISQLATAQVSFEITSTPRAISPSASTPSHNTCSQVLPLHSLISSTSPTLL